MTIKEAKAELKELGIMLTTTDAGYRVNTFNGYSATATIHDNMMDAYETGKAQANIARSIVFTQVINVYGEVHGTDQL